MNSFYCVQCFDWYIFPPSSSVTCTFIKKETLRLIFFSLTQRKKLHRVCVPLYETLLLMGGLIFKQNLTSLNSDYIYVVPSISYPTFFVQTFKIVVDSWKFSMLLLYILWDDWPIFLISGSNEQLQQQLEYTLLKPDCHSWWISKMQSGCEDTLEERYAIKSCFKLGKMPQKHMEYFRLLFDHLAWIEDQFLSGIRDSGKAGSLWAMMSGVGGVRKSIHQSWLVKGLGLLCWGFKGFQEEIRSEKASTLQIGSVAFPPVQCTSPQLHPCHRLFDQDWHQDTYLPSL